jgi:hypothetical protein
MSEIGKLDDQHVPQVAKAWIHNEEILGVTREGDLIILAKIVGESEDSIFNPIPEAKKRPPRKSQPKTNASAPTTAESEPTEPQ